MGSRGGVILGNGKVRNGKKHSINSPSIIMKREMKP